MITFKSLVGSNLLLCPSLSASCRIWLLRISMSWRSKSNHSVSPEGITKSFFFLNMSMQSNTVCGSLKYNTYSVFNAIA